jgi:hypothetical protein
VCQRKHWQEHKKDCKKVVEIVEESEDDWIIIRISLA